MATFDELATACGSATSAMRLCLFAGGSGRRVSVPRVVRGDHLLHRIMGGPAFAELCKHFGGTSIALPALDTEPSRVAGRVFALCGLGLSTAAIAHASGTSRRRVLQILAEFKDGNYKFDLVENDDGCA